MSHTYVVDRIFAAHLRRETHTYTSPNLSEMPTLKDLSVDIRASDREYLHYVARLDRDQMAERTDFRFTNGAPGCMSREEILMHVITHGIGHRGQVSAVMLLNSLASAADGFTTYLHTAEGWRRNRAGGGGSISERDSQSLTCSAHTGSQWSIMSSLHYK